MKCLPNVLTGAAAVAVLAIPARAAPQDSNVMQPVPVLEQMLRDEPIELLGMTDTRFEGDRTQRVTLKLANGDIVAAKWARAPRGGHEFNNAPRYEVGAYVVQKLFLDPENYAVPPTVIRPVPLDFYRKYDDAVSETFRGTDVVFVVLQYWLFNVTQDDVWDEDRFEADTLYARHFADMNVLTYLIRHNDSNVGNALISSDSANPRVFTVDNGLAFGREFSDRGTAWRYLKIDRIARGTAERLRAIRDEELDQLAVVAQYERRNGVWVAVPHTEPANPNDGVTFEDGVVQFGLTRSEIRGVRDRLHDLVEKLDDGDITVF